MQRVEIHFRIIISRYAHTRVSDTITLLLIVHLVYRNRTLRFPFKNIIQEGL